MTIGEANAVATLLDALNGTALAAGPDQLAGACQYLAGRVHTALHAGPRVDEDQVRRSYTLLELDPAPVVLVEGDDQ